MEIGITYGLKSSQADRTSQKTMFESANAHLNQNISFFFFHKLNVLLEKNEKLR